MPLSWSEPVPDELVGLVTDVVAITTAARTQRLDRWTRDLADAVGGAIVVDGQVEYVNRARRLQYRLTALGDDYAGIAAWLRQRDDSYHALLQELRPRVQALRTMDAGPLLAIWPWPEEVAATILALADREDATPVIRERAAQLRDAAAAVEDSRVPKPATVGELRAIYESPDPGRLRRLRHRIEHDWFWLEARPLWLDLAETGWAPQDDELLAMIVQDAAIDRTRDEAVIARVSGEEFAAKGPLARAIHDRAVAHAATFQAQAAERTRASIAVYEKYRDDPLVLRPRPRGMEPALYRALIDALYGEARQHPMLPEAIVMLVCDRRYADAEAAFTAQFGGTAEQAEEAIRDASRYFTPGAERLG